MDIATWRAGLSGWLTRRMAIATWELKSPSEYGKIHGFLPPLQDIALSLDATDTCSGKQDIYLSTRYGGELLYAELPIGDWEQIYTMLLIGLDKQFRSIAPGLLSIEPLINGDPVAVSEYGEGDQADWLLTLRLSALIAWVPVLTLLPGDPGYPGPESTDIFVRPLKIDTGLYTEKLAGVDPLDPATRDKVGVIRAGLKND